MHVNNVVVYQFVPNLDIHFLKMIPTLRNNNRIRIMKMILMIYPLVVLSVRVMIMVFG